MYEMERLYICIFVICISSWVRCLLKCWGCSLTELYIFLLLSFKCSLFVLHKSPLSAVSLQIFSSSLLLILKFVYDLHRYFYMLLNLSSFSIRASVLCLQHRRYRVLTLKELLGGQTLLHGIAYELKTVQSVGADMYALNFPDLPMS